jgi:hypothetical protein
LQRKKFEIRAVGCPDSRKYTYYTSSDDKSKHLLYLCRVTHQFSMAMQPKLAELRKLEEEGELHCCQIAFDPVTNSVWFFRLDSQPAVPGVFRAARRQHGPRLV